MTKLLVRPVPKPWEESPEESRRTCRGAGAGVPRLQPNVDDPIKRTEQQGPSDGSRMVTVNISGIWSWLTERFGHGKNR